MRDKSAGKIKENVRKRDAVDRHRRRNVCFLGREPLSLAKTLKDKENRFNFPNARFCVSSDPLLSSPPFSPVSYRRTPSLRFICLPLARSCPIPSPSGSFSTSASSFPRLFRSRPFSPSRWCSSAFIRGSLRFVSIWRKPAVDPIQPEGRENLLRIIRASP